MNNRESDPQLDKVIHERGRLMILTYLASAEDLKASFTELRNELGFTAGNLSVQLKKLEEAGLVKIEKSFVDNKPYTEVQLTPDGEGALQNYVEEMERLIIRLKKLSPQ